MERFGRVALSIRNLSPEVSMHHMITALRPGPFANSLCKKPTVSLDELRQHATKFMQMEELRDFRNQIRMDVKNEKKTNEREGIKIDISERNLVAESFNNTHHRVQLEIGYFKRR